MASVPIQRTSPLSVRKLLAGDNFFQQVEEMHDRIAHRAYDLFCCNGFQFGRDLDDWFKAEMGLFRIVPLEVRETDEELVISAEVPGFREKDLDIRVEPRRVYITGKREETDEKKKKGKTVYTESSTNELFREFMLPATIDPDKVTAMLNDGVLKLTLPKAELAKKIAIGKAA